VEQPLDIILLKQKKKKNQKPIYRNLCINRIFTYVNNIRKYEKLNINTFFFMFQTTQAPMEYALRTVLRSTRGTTASTSSMNSGK